MILDHIEQHDHSCSIKLYSCKQCCNVRTAPYYLIISFNVESISMQSLHSEASRADHAADLRCIYMHHTSDSPSYMKVNYHTKDPNFHSVFYYPKQREIQAALFFEAGSKHPDQKSLAEVVGFFPTKLFVRRIASAYVNSQCASLMSLGLARKSATFISKDMNSTPSLEMDTNICRQLIRLPMDLAANGEVVAHRSVGCTLHLPALHLPPKEIHNSVNF